MYDLNICTRYSSGSQPVVRGPPVVRSHLSGGPQASSNIYFVFRKNKQKSKKQNILNNCSNFFHFSL